MAELSSDLRTQLEGRIVEARDVSEAAADAALRSLAVHQRDALPHHNESQRALRRALRAKARQLGDPLERDPNNPMPALTRELAYERWHQMLFAAFLAHNHLLIHPSENVPVTLQDCAELATHEGDPDGWHTAARYASHMLPGIFKPTDPLLQVQYAPEHHQTLERILNDIPQPTYTSDDGLGWVYQFWQTKRKKQVNASGRKIGGADIAPVTQLFTEHYMVQFLLHNTLGAWWTNRHPNTPLPTNKSYLRTLEDGTPAAGIFDGWPTTAKDITVMDPCCGSGHFLTAAFTLLQRFRMIEENLTEAEAGDAVLRDNLHGLELDPRCTQLAAFNLALHAWKHGGYRPLPPLNIACSGIPAGGTEQDWTNLTNDPRAKNALKQLHQLFKNAPDLGSLIDPNQLAQHDPLYTANYEEIETLLEKVLATSEHSDPAANIFGEAATGSARAASLLSRRYYLVTTNPPFLSARRMSSLMLASAHARFGSAGRDLATSMLLRAHSWTHDDGVVAFVSPHTWTYLRAFKAMRERLYAGSGNRLIARLGPGAFESITGEIVNVILTVTTSGTASSNYAVLDVSGEASAAEKATALRANPVVTVPSALTLASEDRRVHFEPPRAMRTLASFGRSFTGLQTGDDARFRAGFWEITPGPSWEYEVASAIDTNADFSGRYSVVDWRGGARFYAAASGAHLHARAADGKASVVVRLMSGLPSTLYSGRVWHQNCGRVIPTDSGHLAAIYCFLSSEDFRDAIRTVDASLKVTPSSLLKVPFDLERWQSVAAEKYPHGLPKPYSDDPTQWLFHGHPAPATEPLQVAVARLLGYRWPAETDTDMELSDEARAWITRSAGLLGLADNDGIVCLPPIAGEKPAAERLRNLLAHAYGDRWSPTTEAALLATVGYDGKTLHDWLWGDYFKRHCKLFNNRPFIWHITDGLKDGFSALVNYHKLNRALLERLIYTYLGNWIQQQQDAVNSGTRGADKRLAAAQDLKIKLELILQGEPPYDIFVRWKPLHHQPIGWEPDLNDGVRLNIRPFVTAGILRNKFTINWNKDRGHDPTPNATGTTERHNDRHLTLQEKRVARKAHES